MQGRFKESVVIGAAMISAIVMIANAPAQSYPVLDPVFHTSSMPKDSATADHKPGRLTLTFVPAGEAVDGTVTLLV